MNVSLDRYDEVLETVGYLLGGLLGTAGVAIGVMQIVHPQVQWWVYDLTYLRLGPPGATELATIVQTFLAIVVAVSVPTILAEYVGAGFKNGRDVVGALGALVGLLVAFLLVSIGFRAIEFGPALVLFAVLVIAVPVALRVRGVTSAGLWTFVGSVPVVILLLFGLGFGLGWGGGYYLQATEVSPSSVDGTADASFDEAPAVRDELFTADNSEDGGDVYRLELRGAEHPVEAARFLDSHGVRCPLRNAPRGNSGEDSFVAEHDGSYYRVTCFGFGD